MSCVVCDGMRSDDPGRRTRLALRLPQPAVFVALAGASLWVAHDAVFLVQLGPGEPLARALRGDGHGYWPAASALMAVAGILVLVGVGAWLLTLRRRARAIGVASEASSATPGRLGLTLRLWLRLFAIVAAGFAVQENLEHLGGHDHLIGLAALHGPEYPLALPVLAAVTAVAAGLAGAVLVVERRLVSAISAALARRPARPARSGGQPPRAARLPRMATLARRQAGRAPPALAISYLD